MECFQRRDNKQPNALNIVWILASEEVVLEEGYGETDLTSSQGLGKSKMRHLLHG